MRRRSLWLLLMFQKSGGHEPERARRKSRATRSGQHSGREIGQVLRVNETTVRRDASTANAAPIGENANDIEDGDARFEPRGVRLA